MCMCTLYAYICICMHTLKAASFCNFQSSRIIPFYNIFPAFINNFASSIAIPFWHDRSLKGFFNASLPLINNLGAASIAIILPWRNYFIYVIYGVCSSIQSSTTGYRCQWHIICIGISKENKRNFSEQFESFAIS